MTDLRIRVRPVVGGDRAAVHRLALVNGMFEPGELEGIDRTLDGHLDRSRPDDHWVLAVSGEGDTDDADDVRSVGAVLGAAYYAPEAFADRVWNLYFLAVDPHAHAHGVGTALVRHVVEHLHAAGEDVARILLVETSSTDAYGQARGFYAARGFVEEARVREYGPDDDKVVFWRRLRDLSRDDAG